MEPRASGALGKRSPLRLTSSPRAFKRTGEILASLTVQERGKGSSGAESHPWGRSQRTAVSAPQTPGLGTYPPVGILRLSRRQEESSSPCDEGHYLTRASTQLPEGFRTGRGTDGHHFPEDRCARGRARPATGKGAISVLAVSLVGWFHAHPLTRGLRSFLPLWGELAGPAGGLSFTISPTRTRR